MLTGVRINIAAGRYVTHTTWVKN